MYLLINRDNSINFADDHPIDNRLCFEGVTLVEKPDCNMAEVMSAIPIEYAVWDPEQASVVHDPRYLPLNPSDNEATG